MPFGSLLKKSLSRRKSQDGTAEDSRDRESNSSRTGKRGDRGQSETLLIKHVGGDRSAGHHRIPSDEDPSAPSNKLATGLEHRPDKASDLTKDDLNILFSGAPHFTLEKGRRRRLYPQAFYPWNSDLVTGDLQDRRYLEHETFALSTLHAHLPVLDKLEIQPSSLGPLKQEDAWKRPALEVGVFEVPNMLAYQGKEPGTVGPRHFREEAKSPGQSQPTHSPSREVPSNPRRGAERSESIGKYAQQQNLCQIIHGSPDDWKRLGVRKITMDVLTHRLAVIGKWHDDVVRQGWLVTALDKRDSDTLYDILFTQFLHPVIDPPSDENSKGLKMQIEALVMVLTTPGAWYNLSISKWRLRAGQVLWETSKEDEKYVPAEVEHDWP